jgi:hypothetical protein
MTPLEIADLFGGRLVGTPFMKALVCEAVALLPEEIIKKVTRDVWFLSSSEDAWAYTFKGNDLKDKHLIFVSDELLREDPSQIQYTIIHEIGHVILGHENSMGRKQTQSEIDQQEREADEFAKNYLNQKNYL